MLLAAKDKHGDDTDVAKRPSEDDNEKEDNSGKIAALFGESVSHSSGCTDDDGLGRKRYMWNLVMMSLKKPVLNWTNV